MNILLAHGDRIEGKEIIIVEGKIIDMTTEEAKILIKNCINHNLYGTVGVGDSPPEHYSVESLQQMIEANTLVEKWNESDEAKTPKGRTVCMTVGDRGIAASFVALNFQGGTPDKPNVVGYANGNYVLVISERSLKNKV